MGQANTPAINKLLSVRARRNDSHWRKHRPNPYLRLIMLLVCACGLAAGEAALAKTVYSDTEFDNDDWSNFGPYASPAEGKNGGLSAQQVPAIGTQDAYLEVMLTRASIGDGGVATWAALINDTHKWNPAENGQGPIYKVDFRIDVEQGGGAWTLAVKQGNHVWFALAKRAILRALAPPTITLSIDCLDEEDFVALPGSEIDFEDQPLHPDFSTDGEPISFGIGMGLSCPSNIDCSDISTPTSFDLDNWQVTINPFQINAGLNDAWFEPATAGQGFFPVVFPDLELMFLSWFTYDTERPPDDVTAILGEPGHRWLTAQGGYACDTAKLDIFLTQGGVFDEVEPLPGPPEVVGTMTIEWSDCEQGRLVYDMPSLGLTGIIAIERIAPDNVVLCEALQE